MTMPMGITQPGESLQRARRGWSDEFTDQHGRRFEAQYDLGNNRPIGELAPVGFQPPWLPPMNAIKWDRPGGFRFHWDYATIAAEFADGSKQFYDEVMEFMLEHMQNVEPPEVDEPIPAKARRLFKPPLSAAIPVAAEAGDPWILGVPDTPVNTLLRDLLAQSVNANGREAIQMIRDRTKARLAASGVELVPTIPAEVPASTKARTINSVDLRQVADVTYQEFVGSAIKGGMSMAEAANAWANHKANLATEQAA